MTLRGHHGLLLQASGAASSTWNPADVSPSGGSVLAFSGSDRIATHVGGAATGATVRGITAHSSGGPYYFEAEILVAHTDANGINVGVAKDSATLLDDWSAMGANDILMANGNAIISNPGSGVSGSGVSYNTAWAYESSPARAPLRASRRCWRSPPPATSCRR
jgi:hypothetical protein